MALSQSVLNELERELAELCRRRSQIDVAIKGLKGLLTAEREGIPGAPDRNGGRSRGERALTRLAGAGRQVSLRTRILEIIGAAARADRALVVDQLKQEGFQVSGATSLPIRVSHELSRLRRIGVLRKDSNGTLTVTAKPRDVVAPRESEFAAVG